MPFSFTTCTKSYSFSCLFYAPLFQIKEILAGDKQVAEQIEFALRKLEEREKEEKEEQRRMEEDRLRAEKKKKAAAVNAARESLPHLSSDSPSARVGTSVTRQTSAASPAPSTSSTEHGTSAVSSPLTTPGGSRRNTACLDDSDEDDDEPPRNHRGSELKVAVERLTPKKIASVRKSLLMTAVTNSCRLSEKLQREAAANKEKENDGDLSMIIEEASSSKNSSRANVSQPMDVTEAPKTDDLSGPLTLAESSATSKPEDDQELSAKHHETKDDTEITLAESSATSKPEDDQELSAKHNETKDDTEITPKENEERASDSSVLTNSDKTNDKLETEEKMETDEMFAEPQPPTPDRDNAAREEQRQALLRAISTPTDNNSILNNITFAHKTQEVSAIERNLFSVCDTSAASEASTQNDSLVLHFKSPEAFAKNDEFSRLRKNTTARKLETEYEKNESEKRSSGGLFESLNDEVEEPASEPSNIPNQVKKSKKKKRTSK